MLTVLSFLAPYITAAIMTGCCIGLFVVAYWTFHDDC